MSYFSFTPPRPAVLGCIETAGNKEEKQGLLTDMQREQSKPTETYSEDKEQILPLKEDPADNTATIDSLQISFMFVNVKYLSPSAASTSTPAGAQVQPQLLAQAFVAV